MPEFHASLNAALARNNGPSAEDVEALAEVLHRKLCCDNPGHADWTNCPIDGPCSEDARAVLASDWLAAHTAAAESRGAEIGRRATLDPGAFVKRGPDYDGNAYGERLDQWQNRAIAAGLAAAREPAVRVEGGA